MSIPTDPPGGLDLAEIVGDDWLRLHVWSEDGEATVVLTEAAARVLAGQLQHTCTHTWSSAVSSSGAEQ